MRAADEMALLLDAALQEFQSTFAPLASEDKRYAAAMIANALAIGTRAFRTEQLASRAAFARLYGLDATRAGEDDLERRLVRDIRAGAFDAAQTGRLRALLLERTVARLKISAPDALGASGLG